MLSWTTSRRSFRSPWLAKSACNGGATRWILRRPDLRTGNPVADALSAAIIQYNLPKDRLIGMVDARVPAMFDDPPADDKALKASLRETEGAVFELAAAILGERGAAAKEAAASAGVAYGLTAMFIKLPFLASRQKVFLPSSYVVSRGIDLAAIHRGETSDSFGAALADLRGVASRALQQFRAREAISSPRLGRLSFR